MPGCNRSAREATPARWQAALERAIAGGLEIFTVADSGERMVTSASRLDLLHRTDGYSCSCEAAVAGDAVCAHRAIVRYVLGWLPDVAAPLVRCDSCTGGTVEEWVAGHVAGLQPCSVCNGAGVRPAIVPMSDPNLNDLPIAA